MAQVTRTWSVPTSPRSPHKLPNELKLLAEFEGKKWDKATQRLFAEKLEALDTFEGSVSPSEPDFSARDRINRAPKAYGFVRFDDDRKIKITDAGKMLLKGERLDELFLRQLLKWQYPSPNHNKKNYRGSFSIKPFLEVLRMANALDGLTKYEIGLFCIPLIKFSDTEKTIEEIKKFRLQLNALSTAKDKKIFINNSFKTRFRAIYKEDIESGNIKIREGLVEKSVDGFLKTKIRNAKNDYSDSAIRYFRATGLFTLSATTYRLKISDSKKAIVEDILRNTKREPEPYEHNPSEFLNYLGNPEIPILPQDDINIIMAEVEANYKNCATCSIPLEGALEARFTNRAKLTIDELKNLRDAIEEHLASATVKDQQNRLKNYSVVSEIIDVFDKISDRYNDEIPDKPLFFEWNVWRALSLLDDGRIKGNLKIDINGGPLGTAIGNMPDIECYYDDFVLVTEVTLSVGQKQYETEREPVPRHIGQIIKKLRDANDNRPVYGLFIANVLNPATVAYFYSSRNENVSYYGGKVKVLPLNVKDFVNMLEHANAIRAIKAKHIFNFVKWAISEADNSHDEVDWLSKVNNRVKSWTTIA